MKTADRRETALAGLFFFLATLVFTWPVAPHLADGLGDLWDAKLNAWILHWDFHQTFRDPIHLFDANIFYPAKYALAFSENLYGAALFGFPLYAAGVSTLTVYNLLFLLGMFLSAMSAWALARSVTGDPLASVVAGLVYAYAPWRLAQIPHIQYQWGPFLALLLLFLLRYLDQGRRRDAILFGIFFAWNALSNVHYALFSGILVGLVLVYESLARAEPGFRRRVCGSLLALAIASIAVLPFYLQYAKASKLYGIHRDEGEIEAFSGRPIDFLTAGPQNKLYAPWTQRWAQPEGDFFPGLSVLLLAVAAILRLRARQALERSEVFFARKRGTRLLDGLLLVGLALWVWSVSVPDAVLGPLKLRDPGRIVVFVTALLFARLILAFPRHSGFANLSDFMRRIRIGTRAGLFVSIAGAGVVVALGTHTPYYRFLVQSFGPVLHSIRVPSRGIVLFELALGVLAAWGLSLLTQAMSPVKRRLVTAAAVLVIGFEYRDFPVEIGAVEPDPAPVYRWLSTVSPPGAVVEWPLATDPDVEHTFRSTAHWKPLVNGYSGFGPPHYQELSALLAGKEIPDAVWGKLRGLDASLLIFHPGETEGDSRSAHVRALRKGVAEGKLEMLGSFPNAHSRDYVLRLTSAPAFDPRLPARDRRRCAVEAERRLGFLELVLRPPFGQIASPKENEAVAAGAWGFGWALDDSGIAKVLVGLENGPATPALIGQLFPGVREAYPAYPDADKAGFGFVVPALAPGPHTLILTLVAKDGGETVLKRTIRLR